MRPRVLERKYRRVKRDKIPALILLVGLPENTVFKWQVVHHVDGNHKNNRPENHETICPMCNAVLHAGRGCTILKIVDLYKKSRYRQADVIRRTRILRASGGTDEEIIKTLGLKEQVPFKQDRIYLRRLIAFVSSRRPAQQDFMTRALEYGYDEARRQLGIRVPAKRAAESPVQQNWGGRKKVPAP